MADAGLVLFVVSGFGLLMAVLDGLMAIIEKEHARHKRRSERARRYEPLP